MGKGLAGSPLRSDAEASTPEHDGGFELIDYEAATTVADGLAACAPAPAPAPMPPPRPRANSDPGDLFGDLKIDRGSEHGGLTSMRRSRSSSLTASSAVAVLDGTANREATAQALRAAAQAVGAQIVIDAVATGAELRQRLEERPRVRLVLAASNLAGDALSAVAANAAAHDEGAGMCAVALVAGAGAPPARGPTKTVRGPVGRTLANELLWTHVLPFGPCPVAPERPVSSALEVATQLAGDAEAAAASLRDGGLRGVLALIHRERRSRGAALDRILDGAGGRPRAPAVLVVDDSPVARRLHTRNLQTALAQLGAAEEVMVETANDGVEACAKADASQSQGRCVVLILLDLQMPNLGGVDTARNLRRAGASAPILAVTAAALPRDALSADALEDDAVALAFDDLITKPFTRADAAAAVERWVLPRLHRKRRGASPARLPLPHELPPSPPPGGNESPVARPSATKRSRRPA